MDRNWKNDNQVDWRKTLHLKKLVPITTEQRTDQHDALSPFWIVYFTFPFTGSLISILLRLANYSYNSYATVDIGQ